MKKVYKKPFDIKKEIGIAFASLLEEKSYEEISVCDICNRSKIGRTSFYRYYRNKDGKEQILIDHIHTLFVSFVSKRGAQEKESPMTILDFIDENKNLFRCLHKNDLDMIIFRVFYDEAKLKESDGIALSFLKTYLATGYFGIIYYWMEHDFRYTKEDVIDSFRDIKKKWDEHASLLDMTDKK